MNLYITGHGYRMEAQPTAALAVPTNFELKFYCKENQMFDSTWEKFIVDAEGDVADCPNTRGTGNWEVTTIAAGNAFKEHLLTRPGKMKTYKPLGDMKEIKVPTKRVGLINVSLDDGDILCIKGGAKEITGKFTAGECWLSLSALMVALAGKVPSATVHWCACRSVLDDPTAAVQQGQSPYGGVLT